MEPITLREFDEIFSIMEESFPKDEYRSREKQKALFSLPQYSVYCKREGERIVGFLATWELSEYTFIEHFAIKKEFRSKGLGKEMLRELFSEKNGPFCLEVELPENETARRRILFYQRMGLFYHDYPYMQPSMDLGRKPVPLRIMTNSPSLSEEEFKTLRDLLYEKVYGVT